MVGDRGDEGARGLVLVGVGGGIESLAAEAFELAAAKLPIATTFVKRQVGQ